MMDRRQRRAAEREQRKQMRQLLINAAMENARGGRRAADAALRRFNEQRASRRSVDDNRTH